MNRPPPHHWESRWSDLPIELLQLIVNRYLQFADHVRFGAVCKSWRSSVTSIQPNHRPNHLEALKFPWLAVVSFHENCAGLFSPFEDKFYKNDKLNALHHNILGSSRGWLVTCTHLLNPFANKTVKLAIADSRHASKWRTMVERVALSPKPTGDLCTIAGIYGLNKLVLFRPENSEWQIVNHNHNHANLMAVLFMDGHLYCIDSKYGVMILEEYESTHYRWQAYISTGPMQLKRRKYSSHKILRLAECTGEILMVVEYFNVLYETIGFDVCKLDFSGPTTWTKVSSLGDKMLLQGCVNMLCINAADFAVAGFRPNCIYFEGASHDRNCQWRVFCLEDKRIRSFYPISSYRVRSKRLWLHPNA